MPKFRIRETSGHYLAPVVREYDAVLWDDDVKEPTPEDLKADMERRLGAVVHPMMKQDDYLKAAVDAMFSVVAEHLAKLRK